MLNASHETIMQHLKPSEGYGSRKMYQIAQDPGELVMRHRKERLGTYAKHGVIIVDEDEIKGDELAVAREILYRIAELENAVFSRTNCYTENLGRLKLFSIPAPANQPVAESKDEREQLKSILHFRTNP
jgi:hypothetical protein